MPRLSEFDKLVAEEFECTKGSGARKLVRKEVLGYKTHFARRSNSLDRTSTPGMEKELLKNKRKCIPC